MYINAILKRERKGCMMETSIVSKMYEHTLNCIYYIYDIILYDIILKKRKKNVRDTTLTSCLVFSVNNSCTKDCDITSLTKRIYISCGKCLR